VIARHSSCDVRNWTPENRYPCNVVASHKRGGNKTRVSAVSARLLAATLHPELLKLGLPVVCLETRHVRAALSAQRNKTDKADALGLAHLMRTGRDKSGATCHFCQGTVLLLLSTPCLRV
jgi:hypothetical protein